MADTAEGAPPWIGLVLSPWLAGPWLAGAWIARRDGSWGWGAAAGVVLLSATVVAYLVLAGPLDAPALLPGLPLLAVSAGLGFGAAGAGLHHGERGRLIAAVALGGTFVVEGVLLQQVAAAQPLARAPLVVEAVAGVALAAWIGGLRAAAVVLIAGLLALGLQAMVQTATGPELACPAYCRAAG